MSAPRDHLEGIRLSSFLSGNSEAKGVSLEAPPGPLSSLGIAAAAYLVVFGLEGFYLRPLAHHLYTHFASLLVSAVLAAISIGVGIWVTFAAARLGLGSKAAGGLALLLGVAWAALEFAAPVHWLNRHPHVVEFWSALAGLSLATGAAFLGRAFALAFQDRNLVAAAAIIGALVDYWGVNYGTTREIVQRLPALHHHVSVHLPHLGPTVPLVGPGDYVFIGILLALVCRFDLRPRVTAWVMWLLLFVSMMGVLVADWSVPAIVPMAAAVLLPNLRQFRFQRSEAFALLYVGILLVLLALAWWWLHHRH